MAGLFDTLSLGSRSLSTYRKAIDTTGHNLSNVSTPGYTRQRLAIESVSTDSASGPVGAGAEGTKIVRLHSDLADRQIQVENSVQGSLQAKQDALEQSLSALQETINRSDSSGTSTQGISQSLSDFFASVQNLTTVPGSIPDRQAMLQKAQDLASKFNQVDSRLGALQKGLNEQVTTQTGQVNDLTNQIAKLNASITSEEALSGGFANDLRDSRQLKLQELSKLVKFDAAEQPNGAVNIVVGGVALVEGKDVTNTLETFDPGDGNVQVRAAGQTTALALTGGSIEGTMSVRDGEIADARTQVNALAASIISEVNQAHAAGFSLTGSTGENFFNGTNASDMTVNSTLVARPELFQGSGNPNATGDNTALRAMSDLSRKAQAALGGQTFSGKQAQTVSGLAQQLASTRSDLDDQNAITRFVQAQRDSAGGVSVDEEMANLVLFQKAFEASAKLISMADDMLGTIIQM